MAGYNDEHENEYDLRARQAAFATTLIDVQISLAMRPEYMRDGVKIGFLPPQHWPEVLRRLQATYRRATGEQHAILVVENGDAI